MIPLSDDNPTLRTPIVTYLLLGAIGATWVFVQGAGLDAKVLSASVCNLGLVPGELTGLAPPGLAVPLGPGLDCVVDNEALNRFTPITSMFLHAGWGHILGNCLFFWVFGNNVEDSMGRLRFLVFYLVCGLAAAAAQVVVDPSSPIPVVGASGAISGVMGAYLILYPRVRVNMLFIIFIIIRVIPLPAWVVLLWWFGLQVITGLPQLNQLKPEGGVAVWAHVGGFIAGLVLVKLFENRALTSQRTGWRHRLHPDHP
ncbi:rhomboid family intramembrane serine protease [Archangium lansingense]|uniref:rhomboid family intramembrane serine protease n=1 Tax=Archangium lansingense TaxID=2995310 RepID=UPI003B82A3BB